MQRYLYGFFMMFLFFFLQFQLPATANQTDPKDMERYERRFALYKKVEAVTNIPWYYIAAADQYERNIRAVRKDLPDAEGVTGFYFTNENWVGITNPDPADENPLSISFFHGQGMDGNGDGKARITDDEDVLFSFANHILKYGVDHENIKIALWDYYKRDQAVRMITGFAKIYEKHGKLNLDQKVFPLPLQHNYTYRSTWGFSRGWGGRRIHEGTDIFASYGVPVRSTTYGVIEMKGWNMYGGWRVGIRDLNNTYHYYAHLSGFAKDIQLGQIVEPGTVIGGVGSTGYGPPGTAGKFPPHLHYGMYKYDGRREWSFDPYPHLRKWERLERQSRT